jgi:2-keto-4-pentenoate hydratase
MRQMGVSDPVFGFLVDEYSVSEGSAIPVAMLVNHLGRRGRCLPAGSLVLSGGITEAVAVQAGDHVTLRVQHLGSVSLRFT